MTIKVHWTAPSQSGRRQSDSAGAFQGPHRLCAAIRSFSATNESILIISDVFVCLTRLLERVGPLTSAKTDGVMRSFGGVIFFDVCYNFALWQGEIQNLAHVVPWELI